MARAAPAAPPLDLRRIREELTASGPAPAYLLLGEDRFIKSRMVETLTAHLTGAEVTPAQGPDELGVFLSAVRTKPMWGGSVVVVLQEAEALADVRKKKKAERLLQYLKDPSPWAVAVLEFDDGKSNATVSAWRKSLMAYCQTHTCGPLSRAQAKAWVTRRLKQARLAPGLADYLWERTQGHPEALDSELEKLALVAADGEMVDMDTARRLVLSDERDEPFELTNAIQDGNPQRALTALHRELERDGEPFRLLGQVARFARGVLLVVAAVDAGKRPDEVAQDYKMHPTRAAILAKLGRRLPSQKLIRLMSSLALADKRLKLGGDPTPILERLVASMAWSGRRAR